MEDTKTYGHTRVPNGLNIIAGIWLIISAFALHYATMPGALWNDVVVGVVVLILAAAQVAYPRSFQWSWLNAALGIWLIVGAFALRYATSRPFRWNNLVMGIIVALLSLWSALSSRRRLEATT
jgi:uncharacterized membrane protein HdeD (DUF308 family)